jgi:hypothetical protein
LSTQTKSQLAVSVETTIAAPLTQLYYLVSTRSGWLDWFADKGFGNVAKHGILQIHHPTAGPLAFLFEELIPEEQVRMTVLCPETKAMSEAVVHLAEDGDMVTVSLEHTGLEEEEQARWEKIWREGLESLKEILETGKDPRMWNRPFLGVTVEEWVTPELAAKKGIPTEFGLLINNVFEGKGAEQAGIRGGDTIISLAGFEIRGFQDLLNVYAEHKAGATIEVQFYQGESLKTADLTLSAYPVPEVPATAQDVADNLSAVFKKVNKRIDQLLEGKNEAQVGYRPAAGEWHAKEVIAHIIASEQDSMVWLSSYISGREIYPYTSGVPARLKAILAMYPTMQELRKKLAEVQKELVMMLGEVPADVVSRKTSLLRLAFTYSMDASLHYKDHLAQLKAILEAAENVEIS